MSRYSDLQVHVLSGEGTRRDIMGRVQLRRVIRPQKKLPAGILELETNPTHGNSEHGPDPADGVELRIPRYDEGISAPTRGTAARGRLGWAVKMTLPEPPAFAIVICLSAIGSPLDPLGKCS